MSMKLRKELTTNQFGFPNCAKKMYLNEHLTLAAKILFRKARVAAKEKGFKFTWTKNGKNFMRKSEDAKPLQISDENFLLQLK